MASILLIIAMSWRIDTAPVPQFAEFNRSGGIVLLPPAIRGVFTCVYTPVTYQDGKEMVAVLCIPRLSLGSFVSIEAGCKPGGDSQSQSLFLNTRLPLVYKYLIRLTCVPDE